MAETSQGNFPDNIALQFETFTASRLEQTDQETAYSGREVRRARFALGGFRAFKAQTAPLTQADAQLLRDFMKARRGKSQAFQVYQPDKELYAAEPAGSVAAATTIIIPFKSGTYTAVYVAGVSKAFTVSSGVGGYLEDQINFTGGAQTGAVTFDGTARAKLLVRSDLDNYEHALMATTDYRTIWTLSLKEVI